MKTETEEFVYLANEDFYELPREAEWKGYLPSNHVNLIDFQDTNNPKVQRMKNMNYSRAGGHSTILPTGDVFVHGGVSFKGSTNNFDDKHFSVLKPEIYRTKKIVGILCPKLILEEIIMLPFSCFKMERF